MVFPSGDVQVKTKNQIDYIFVKKRWKSSIQQTKTYPGTDCGTDHELLISIIKIKLRKIKKPEPPVRFDLTQIPEEYGIEIKNKFGILMAVEECTINTTNNNQEQDTKKESKETTMDIKYNT